MKKLIVLVVMLTWGSLQAQNDCSINKSLYYESFKQGKMEEAYGPWLKVFDNCPATTEDDKIVYYYGEQILNSLIESKPMERNKYIDQLNKMHDQHIKNYPADKCLVEGYKADLMKKYNTGSEMDQYNQYLKAVGSDCKDAVLESSTIFNYFETAKKLLDAGQLQTEDVLKAYDISVNRTENSLNSRNVEINNLQTLKDSVGLNSVDDDYLTKLNSEKEYLDYYKQTMEYEVQELLTCDRIIPIYEGQYEANKSDLNWLKNTAQILDRKECTESAFFDKIADQWAQLNPSPESKATLAVKAYKKGQYSQALDLFNEALNGETDRFKRGQYYYVMANIKFKQGSYQAAANYARKAADEKPGWGAPYLLIANSYAKSANSCGSDEFEKRAVYWAAADMANKAKAVDPSSAYAANRAAQSFESLAPDKSLLFRLNKTVGGSQRIGCWINTSTRIR